jgi:hypothetical protein
VTISIYFSFFLILQEDFNFVGSFDIFLALSLQFLHISSLPTMNTLGKFVFNNNSCRQTAVAPLLTHLTQYTLCSVNWVPMKANSVHVLKIRKVMQTQG